ncbi:hypothetical protein C8R48DRAFT_736242 [Suillus tomentosus]|nr:hypothetical protein C8R48DRAFT_736242 [Suillus tomentosus]
MASACSFHGIVGIQNAMAYSLDSKKRFWKMEGFVPVSLDPEDSAGDLPVSVFVFGGKTAPPDDGIYFINARVITTTVDEETTLELYCVDDMQSTDGGRSLPTVMVVGKVAKGSSELVEGRGFDVDIMQYAIMPQQLCRIRCYYPEDHPRLAKTPVPTAEKHVIVQGCITELRHKRCVVSVHDITLGPSTGMVEKRRHAEAVPPVKLKSFNWKGGKKKRSHHASHTDSERDSDSTQQKGKKRRQDPLTDVVEEEDKQVGSSSQIV